MGTLSAVHELLFNIEGMDSEWLQNKREMDLNGSSKAREYWTETCQSICMHSHESYPRVTMLGSFSIK